MKDSEVPESLAKTYLWGYLSYKTTWRSILLFLLFVSLFLLTLFKLLNHDIWFHVKAGQTIAESGKFIYGDIFSYTATGREWVYHEWLFGVISYEVYSFFGINGLILLKSAVLLFAFLVIYKDMRLRGVSPYLAYFLLFLAATASRFRFVERPHIFKYLFLAVFIYLLDLNRLKGKNRLWLLPLVQILWTNIHGSFILGPAIVFIYLIPEAFRRNKDNLLNLSAVLLVVLSVTLVNPYGWRLIPFSTGFEEREVIASIKEWAPLSLNDFYSVFGLLFVLAVASFIASFAAYRRVSFVDISLFFLFSYLSMKALRFSALFSLMVAPVTAYNCQSVMQRYSLTLLKKLVLIVSAVSIMSSSLILEIRRNPGLVFGFGQDPAFPERALNFIKETKIEGNMYNSYIFGGYIIWRLYPERKVFVDGRVEIYPAWLQRNFVSLPSWDAFLNASMEYDINYAIIAYKTDSLGEFISRDSGWVLVYWDEVARVYVRKDQRNAGIINSYGYEVLTDPEGFSEKTITDALENRIGDRLELELRRRIELDQADMWAWHWLGALYSMEGREEDALATWREGVKIKPDADLYNNIGSLLFQQGRYQESVTYFKLAIETDGAFAEAYYNLGKNYEELGRKEDAAQAYRGFIKYAGDNHAEIIKEVKWKLNLGIL